jgi:hypothetical protein|tara:strand:- start:4 stop:288 length:285 start_codon:yes stop_codon:yes gene_type:complete
MTIIDRIDAFLVKGHKVMALVFAIAGLAMIGWFRPDIYSSLFAVYNKIGPWTLYDQVLCLMGPAFLIMFAVWFGWVGAFINLVSRELLNIARYQ